MPSEKLDPQVADLEQVDQNTEDQNEPDGLVLSETIESEPKQPGVHLGVVIVTALFVFCGLVCFGRGCCGAGPFHQHCFFEMRGILPSTGNGVSTI